MYTGHMISKGANSMAYQIELDFVDLKLNEICEEVAAYGNAVVVEYTGETAVIRFTDLDSAKQYLDFYYCGDAAEIEAALPWIKAC